MWDVRWEETTPPPASPPSLPTPPTSCPPPLQAPYDLDNLRLADLPAGHVVAAEFDLEAIMLTGSCIDQGSKGVSVEGGGGESRTLRPSCSPAAASTRAARG